MGNQEHWKDFFREDYLRFSETILTPERTTFEVNQLVQQMQFLGVPNGAKILDAGCGQGRISVPLAQRGYQVIGYDGSGVLLEEAKNRARIAGVDIPFFHGDMRELAYAGEFDVVLNLGTAFGYVENEADDLAILKRICNALKPGGYFIQETENREWKLRNQMGKTWHVMNGQPVWSDREFNLVTGRWKETITWMHGSALQQQVLDLRMYTATELIRLTKDAGLELQSIYGGFDYTPLTEKSPRLLLLSRKAG
jgi:2-polyprenyl-3-methyl-5-hydroxy-6-metoxy-1,4-benzoquinol methylase